MLKLLNRFIDHVEGQRNQPKPSFAREAELGSQNLLPNLSLISQKMQNL